MEVRSLGLRTDLFFPAFDGEILDRGHYLVVRTPASPDYYWGNFLAFSRPPRKGDLSVWQELFAREMGAPPDTKHQAFIWDSPEGLPGDAEPFLNVGFRLNRDEVMTGTGLHPPPRPARNVLIRALESEQEWEQAIDLQVACRERGFSDMVFREFRSRMMSKYRKMVEAGRGDWYGAFVGAALIADLGIFHNGTIGRYQSVETHPEYRRQGIAGTLVYEAGRRAMETYGLQVLVMVAEEGSSATSVYRSVGFETVERQASLERWPEFKST